MEQESKMNTMIKTAASREAIMDSLSDLHKDVYGFRPRETFWARANNADLAELRKIYQDLRDSLEDELKQEAIEALRGQRDFEGSIKNMIFLGASDRITAIKWLVQSSYGDHKSAQDVEDMLFRFSVDYTIVPQYMSEIGFVRRGMRWNYQGD